MSAESLNVEVSAVLVQRLYAAGLLARPVAQEDPRLVVGVVSPGQPLGSDAFALLSEVAPTVVELNLQNSGVGDAELAGFERFAGLRRLRLSGNRITDAGLRSLSRLAALEHLNLYGNPGVQDVGLTVLAGLPALRELYLWQTAVTAEGLERFAEQRPDVMVHNGNAAFAVP
jgi:Leucine rich repeat